MRPKGYKCSNVKCDSCVEHSMCGELGDAAMNCVDRIITRQTNADRIRAMSDEELTEFLSKDLKEPCDCCQLAVFEGACTETLCDDAMMKWLQQPLKGE